MVWRKLSRTLSLLLVVAASAVLLGCPVYYGLLELFFFSYGVEMGDVVITLTMRDVSEPLTYYQAHMAGAAPGTAEYSWGVEIDTDDDPTTGDAEGFDVTLIVKLETGGDATVTAPLSATMAELLPETTVTPEVIQYADKPRPRRAGLAVNTLYIGASTDERTSFWWISTDGMDGYADPWIPLSPTFRARFFARYNDAPDPATEIVDTVELIGNGTQSDPPEDVAYSFIDIVEVRIENAPAGVQ